MSEMSSHSCVMLPCSSDRFWVVPQSCLGEIVTVPASEDQPPAAIEWRGENVPVVDFGREGPLCWRDPRGASGLVAIILGQRDETYRYFGIALRGGGGALGVGTLDDETVEDLPPDAVLDYSTAAFRMRGNIYQVPDLLALQRAIGAGDIAFQ